MFQNHIVIENWNEDINILHLISKAYQNRDLKQLIELITTISFFMIFQMMISFICTMISSSKTRL